MSLFVMQNNLLAHIGRPGWLAVAEQPISGQPPTIDNAQSGPPLPWQIWSDRLPGGTYSGLTSINCAGYPDFALVATSGNAVSIVANTWESWSYQSDYGTPGLILNNDSGLALAVVQTGGEVGWGVTMQEADTGSLAQQWNRSLLGCNSVLTCIENKSDNSLTVTAKASEGTVGLSDPLPLAPNSSVYVVSSYDGGLSTAFQIWDASYSTTNSVASFDIHQHKCISQAGEIWTDNTNFVAQYSFEHVEAYPGDHDGGWPGTVQVVIVA